MILVSSAYSMNLTKLDIPDRSLKYMTKNNIYIIIE